MSLDLHSIKFPADRPVVVAGLSMQMALGGGEAVLGGPAIYAALGVGLVNRRTALLSAVGQDLSDADEAIVALVDDERAPQRKSLARPMITWRSPAVLGDTGRGTLSDDPSLWRAMPSNGHSLDGGALVLANGDPDWYQSLLSQHTPALIFMDAHMEWLRMRERALNACLKKADVVTITETEYKALPLSAKSGVDWGGHDKALIIKRGAHGVTLLVGRQRRDLPPPAPLMVRTDVGCGDFLIGLMAGHFMAANQSPPEPLIDLLSHAYLDSLQDLAPLLESDSPKFFIDCCVSQIRSGKNA